MDFAYQSIRRPGVNPNADAQNAKARHEPKLDHDTLRDIDQVQSLFESISNCGVNDFINNFKRNYNTIKRFLSLKNNEKRSLDDLKSQCFALVEYYIKIELPDVVLRRDIVSLCLSNLLSSSSWEAKCAEILKSLLSVPKHCTNIPQIDQLFDAFMEILNRYENISDSEICRTLIFCDVIESLASTPFFSKNIISLLPSLARFVSSSNSWRDVKCHMALVRVCCHALHLCGSITPMVPFSFDAFAKDVYNQLVALLSSVGGYGMRSSLISCMAIFASSGLCKKPLKDILQSDILISLNSAYKQDSAITIGIMTVYIECLRNLDSANVSQNIIDRCLVSVSDHWMSDNYHVRERCFTLLLILTGHLASFSVNYDSEGLRKACKIASVLFYISSSHIQNFKVEHEKWSEIGFVTYARLTINTFIGILSNCVGILSNAEKLSKEYSEQTDSLESCKNGGLDRIESSEICRVFCCLLEIASNANAARCDCLYDVEGSFLQENEIKEILRYAIKFLATSFRPFIFHQWFKLMLPIIFSMGIADQFLMYVFECFKLDYGDIFAPHILAFIIQILEIENNCLDYLKNIVTYSEGVIGIFCLNSWEPCDKRILRVSEAEILRMSMSVLENFFLLFSSRIESVKACQNEILDIISAINRLSMSTTNRLLTAAITLFRNLNRANSSVPIYEPFHPILNGITCKILRKIHSVHRDWIEFLFVVAVCGPFTEEFVSKCSKPVFFALRDFDWKLVTAALELLESWTEQFAPEVLYQILSQVLIYKCAEVRPNFIQCLTNYLQDNTLKNYASNAQLVSRILSKLGSCSLNFSRNLSLKTPLAFSFALPVGIDDSGSKNSAINQAEIKYPTMERCEIDTFNKTVAIGVPVLEGLQSVVRQMSKGNVTQIEFEGCSGFVLSAVAPLMDYSASLSECWLNLTANPKYGDNRMPKYISFENSKAFVKILMKAFIKVLAKGQQMSKNAGNCEIYRDLLLLRDTLLKYLVMSYHTLYEDTIEAALDPSMFIEAVVSRLLLVREDKEKFFFGCNHVNPFEAEISASFLFDLVKLGLSINCTRVCENVINVLCLCCNSKNASKRAGACKLLGKFCGENAEYIKPFVSDIAYATLQLSDCDFVDVMFGTLEALVSLCEEEMFIWSLGLLEHPMYQVRLAGQFCLKRMSNREELKNHLNRLGTIFHECQYPDIFIFLASYDTPNPSLVEMVFGIMQPCFQSLTKIGDTNGTCSAEAEFYFELVDELLSEEEYGALLSEVEEESIATVLIYLLKFMVIGSDEIAERAERILQNAKNANVDSGILTSALEEYIIQLQTIFDDRLLEKIVSVVSMYRDHAGEALIESLFNIAKSFIEGQLTPSLNAEYKNARFLGYIKFLAKLGFGKSCLDIIFDKWFECIDCIKQGIIIPGSVAFGIWQVFVSCGGIYNIIEHLMKKRTHFDFVYFVRDNEVDLDHINTFLTSARHTDVLQVLNLVQWIYKSNPSVTEPKKSKSLIESLVSISDGYSIHLEGLVLPPFVWEFEEILSRKVAYTCYMILSEMCKSSSFVGDSLAKFKDSIEYKCSMQDGSALERTLNRITYPLFFNALGSTANGAVELFDPKTAAFLFNSRAHKLKHLLILLNDHAFPQLAKGKDLLEEIVSFTWESTFNADTLDRLIAICCLSKVVSVLHTPPIGAVSVFKRFVDVLASQEVYFFLNRRHLIFLDFLDAKKQPNGIFPLICASASSLILSLACVTTQNELFCLEKDKKDPKTTFSIWIWILMEKIRENENKLYKIIPLIGSVISHLHNAVEILNSFFHDLLKLIADDSMNASNRFQCGHLETFFGILAIFEGAQIELDSKWVSSACIKLFLFTLANNHLSVRHIEKYEDIAFIFFIKSFPFATLDETLKRLSLITFTRDLSFKNSHLWPDAMILSQGSKSLSSPPNKVSDYKKLNLCLQMQKIVKTEFSCGTQQRSYYQVSLMALRIVNRVLDHSVPEKLNLVHVTSVLSRMWNIRSPKISRIFQRCIYKLGVLFIDQFVSMDVAISSESGSFVKTTENLQVGACAKKDKEYRGFAEWIKASIIEELQFSILCSDDLGNSSGNTQVPISHTDSLQQWGESEPVHFNNPDAMNAHLNKAVVSPQRSLSPPSVTPLPPITRFEDQNNNLKSGACFSTAIQSFISLLKAFAGNLGLFKRILQAILPSFISAFCDLLAWNMGHMDIDFSAGQLKIQNCLCFFPSKDKINLDMTQEEYNFLVENDEGRLLERLMVLIVHSLKILPEKSRHMFMDILKKFTTYLSHPYNNLLLKHLSFVFSSSIEGVQKDGIYYVPEELYTYKYNMDVHSDDADDVEFLAFEPLKLTKMVVPSWEIINFEDIHFERITSTNYPKQLLDFRVSDSIEITCHEIYTTPRGERTNSFDNVSFMDVLRILEEIVKNENANCDRAMIDNEYLRLEIMFSIRNLSNHPILHEKFNEFYYECLNNIKHPDICSNIKDKLVAYSSCLTKQYSRFMDSFRILDLPKSAYAIIMLILKTDLPFNLGNEFYIPLLLDMLSPIFLDEWEIGISEDYPRLPSLASKRSNLDERSQIDIICDPEFVEMLKPSVLLLREFRKMQNVNTSKEAVNSEVNHDEDPSTGNPLSFEVMEGDMEHILEILKSMNVFNVRYLSYFVKVRNFVTHLRKMWHSDHEYAKELWVSIFPQLYDTLSDCQREEIASAICIYLSRVEHMGNKNPNCITILQAALMCHPPINIAPEILKHLALNFGTWYESVYHLEKQILAQPLDITKTASVLSDVFEKLNMSDLSIGASRTWVITQESRLALCYLQHSKWKQAQREFNVIMDALALTGQIAEAVSSFDESKMWYNGWVQCTKQLGEWDIVRDVAYAAGDHKLFMQASTALQDWGNTSDSVWNSTDFSWVIDNAECVINRVYHKFNSAILPFRQSATYCHPWLFVQKAKQMDKLIDEGKRFILDSWVTLPKGLCEAHEIPLQLHQRYLEIDEGVRYVTGIMFNLCKGIVPEEPVIVNRWRKRLPRSSDQPSVWHELLSWRSFVYSSVKSIVMNSSTISKDIKHHVISSIQDLPWTLTKFASVSRKFHQLPLMASVLLNKAQKFQSSLLTKNNFITEDCFVIVIERIKQYLSLPMNSPDFLKSVINLDIEKLPSKGCEALKAQIIRLKADALHRKSTFELPKRQSSLELDISCKYTLEALKLEPLLSKNWISWAKFNDKKIDRGVISQRKSSDVSFPLEQFESAITGYLIAVSIRPSTHWLLLGRVFTLLGEMHSGGGVGVVSDAFKKYSERIPIHVWLLWLPQLLSGLGRAVNIEFQHILQFLMLKAPQQVFYSLRSEYLAQYPQAEIEISGIGNESGPPLTMKRLLGSLISSNPTVGTMLESFATTLTQLGKPDFLDEILCAAETIFEECLDLPFNEQIPSPMLHCLSVNMPQRATLYNEMENFGRESKFTLMMKEFGTDFRSQNGWITCGETMNKLLNWITKLSSLAKTTNLHRIKQKIASLKLYRFCQRLQVSNFNLQLPTLQSSTLFDPKQKQCIGECFTVVSINPSVRKRKRGNHIIKSISIFAQDGFKHVYSLHPLALRRQKSEQHVFQMIRLINVYSLKYSETRKRNIVLPTTNLIPLDPYVCLFEDDYMNETLSTILSDAVSFRNLALKLPENSKTNINIDPLMNKETNLLLLILHKILMENGVTQQLSRCWNSYNPGSVENLTFTQVYQLFKDKKYPWFATWYKKVHQDVIQDAYNQLCALVPDDILFTYAFNRYKNYQSLLTFRIRLTTSYASQAILSLMFSTPYVTPCKLSINFSTGLVKQFDFRLNYSRELFVEYSKLRIFRFTRNIKTMVGSVCRLGTLPAVMYSLCSCIHAYKIDIHGALASIFSDEFSSSFNDSPRVESGHDQCKTNQHSDSSQSATPVMEPKVDISLVDEYISRTLNYCSYLRSPGDQEHCNVPINNVITCIIDASADSVTLGKLKTSYQPWL